jgi:hypothetical protein
MDRACCTHETEEYKILVGKSEGKRPLGRPRHMWKNNIKIDIEQMEWEGVDSIRRRKNDIMDIKLIG